MRMDINLSSRPFQNHNLFHCALISSCVLAFGLSFYNAWSATASSRAIKAYMASRSKSEWDSAKGKELADKLDREIAGIEKRPELALVPFVNQQIDRRSLSWIRLLDWLEATMPPAVIVTSINPSLSERGMISLGLSFTAKELDAAIAFMKRMRSSPAFPSVMPLSESTSPDHHAIQYQIHATYNPAAGAPPPPSTTDDDEKESEEGER